PPPLGCFLARVVAVNRARPVRARCLRPEIQDRGGHSIVLRAGWGREESLPWLARGGHPVCRVPPDCLFEVSASLCRAVHYSGGPPALPPLPGFPLLQTQQSSPAPPGYGPPPPRTGGLP